MVPVPITLLFFLTVCVIESSNLGGQHIIATKTPKIPFKTGDDFTLTLTVTNKVSVPALAAETAVIEAQTTYDALLIAEPLNAVNTTAAPILSMVV